MLRELLKTVGVYKIYEQWLYHQVDKTPEKLPQHIGVIIDGNRRWAYSRGLPFLEGHKQGVIVAKEFLQWCYGLGIKTVSVYVFSTENFKRSKDQVEGILRLIETQVKELAADKRIHEYEVRTKAMGRLNLLPDSLQKNIKEIEYKTKDYDKHYLNILIAYGGESEIVDATKEIGKDLLKGKIALDQINEELLGKYLYTAELPEPRPDLVVRTSGEQRLSGFMPLQSTYSELLFLDAYWPDFRRIDFLRAIRTYQKRKRRFGV